MNNWYRHLQNGSFAQVEPGSEEEAALLARRDDDNNRVFEKVDSPEDEFNYEEAST